VESSAADAGRVAPPPRRWGIDRRLMGVAVVTEITALLLAYVAVNRPVVGPKLTSAERLDHWPVAVIGATVVALVVLFVARETLRARRLDPSPNADSPSAALTEMDRPRIPHSIRVERAPRTAVLAAAVVSPATIPLSVIFGASFPLAWLAFLAPWIPIVAIEARWKFARDTLFASFGLLVILQLLHMVEHSVQVGQLVATNGALADSHGIFGQLDFELVHFVTDTTLWISLGMLVIVFKGRNAWLVVAFVAASLHQVEHFYLIYINHADNAFYLSGGAAGIMGHYGIIGSPLDRPYLHYTYNFIVFVPMVIAIWDEARRVDRKRARALAAPRAASS